MTLPNFLIIGVAKSGTTSLAHYLNQHPQVFIPPGNKEPNFFITEGLKLPAFSGPVSSSILYDKIFQYSITDIGEYQALFNDVYQEIAIGEASVPYLYYPKAAERIKHYIPEAKMIVMLRNPIDRAYSHYLMVREKYLLEPLELTDAIDQEAARIRQNWGWDWHYTNMGMYYRQLKVYFDCFKHEQIRVFLYDDYCTNPLKVVQDIYRFINVDFEFVPDLSQRNKVSAASRSYQIKRWLNSENTIRTSLQKVLPSRVFHKVVNLGNRWNNIPVPTLEPEIRTRLKTIFLDEILQLQDLIHRDLSAWL